MGKKPPDTPRELLDDWYRRARESQFAHYEAVKPLVRANYLLGIPVVILSTFVGTSVFATLQEEVEISTRIIVGSVSVLAAVLASLQTFLRLSERAEKYRAAAVRYGSLRRQIEVVISSGTSDVPDPIKAIQEGLDSISSDAPEIPDKIWKRTESLLENRP